MSEVDKLTLESKDLERDFKSTESLESQDHAKALDKIYRKLDLRIIPALWCLYFMTSLVGNSWGLTLTMNGDQGHSLVQTLNLTGKDISTASALDYVGFIIFDLPMNLVMTRVKPHTWLSRIVFSMGLVTFCYTFLKDRAGLIAIRFITGVAVSGFWPGMTLYLTYFYPVERTTKRIGFYFTAAQIACAVAGLINAGFQKMDGARGYRGWQWMYLICGTATMFVAIISLWWLPDKPVTDSPDTKLNRLYNKFLKTSSPLTEEEQILHRKDLEERYKNTKWTIKDLVNVFCDLRIWPLILMYFGVVGTGYGLAVFATTIIKANNPSLTSIDVSLLYAPIWLFDFAGILLITPFSDKYKKFRYLIFSGASLIIIIGMIVATYASSSWSRYGGLLIAGFGLGPTVPTCMAMAAEIFAPKHKEIGISVACALVSGLGNLGSVVGTYALYSGWPADVPRLYEYSNMMLVLMLGVSIVSAFVCQYTRDFEGFKKSRTL